MTIGSLLGWIQSIVQRRPLLFLVTLALAIRLYHVDAPILGIHAWRQSDTAAIARNFYENGFNFWYPQIDWGGSGPGYCETEFPIYSFLVAILYQLFGFHDATGRLFSIAWCLVGIVFLYQLAQDLFEEQTAFWACVFYSILPLSVYYSRTVQPESMLMTCSILSIFYFRKWLRSAKSSPLLLSSFFLTIACLMKVLPLLYLGIPLIYLAFSHFGQKAWRQPQLWGYLIVPIISVVLWYAHAHQLFLTYGNTFGFSAATTDRYTYSILLTPYFWSEILVKVAVRHFAIVGFFIFIAGLFHIKGRSATLLSIWLLSAALCWVLVPVTSVVHEYYLLPFMIPGVIVMGKACSVYLATNAHQNHSIKPLAERAIGVGIILTFISSAAFYNIDYIAKENSETSPIFALAQQIKTSTAPNALVIATTGNDPTLLYLSHRKGWLVNPADLTPVRLVQNMEQGADYLVGSFDFVESYTTSVGEEGQQVIRNVLQQYPNTIESSRHYIAKLSSKN